MPPFCVLTTLLIIVLFLHLDEVQEIFVDRSHENLTQRVGS